MRKAPGAAGFCISRRPASSASGSGPSGLAVPSQINSPGSLYIRRIERFGARLEGGPDLFAVDCGLREVGGQASGLEPALAVLLDQQGTKLVHMHRAGHRTALEAQLEAVASSWMEPAWVAAMLRGARERSYCAGLGCGVGHGWSSLERTLSLKRRSLRASRAAAAFFVEVGAGRNMGYMRVPPAGVRRPQHLRRRRRS